MNEQKQYVCPWCGGKDVVEGIQSTYANAYASMQHRSADKLLYIQSPIRRSPARMDCGVFGFDKV